MFVLPYFLLGVAWIGSNPPGAAPDELDHLTKALGVARLDIGEEYNGPPQARNPVGVRNASISRLVEIPSQLNPEGYRCMARKPNETAACLPTTTPAAGGQVERITPVGAYPPFTYFLPGVAAHATNSPAAAFFAARFVFLLLATALLLVGAQHLVRWLGRPALLGAFVGLTPVAVFTASIVSTSGLEIASAFAVAAVAVVAIRRPESLAAPGTQVLLAVAGASLVLSRQLGMVTLGVLLVVVALRVGWRCIWGLLREHRPVFVASLLTLVLSGVATALWELRYDHPSDTGTPFSWLALQDFVDRSLIRTVHSGVGEFGWLDSPLPQLGTAAWIIAVVLICGMGLVLAHRADRWTLLAVLSATIVVAYVVYAVVFFTISASLQGRHMLPMFVFLPLLSGIVVVERLDERGLRDALRRLFLMTGGLVAVLHALSLYYNARRYAVGVDGPLLFLGRSLWRPEWGWAPWLLLGAAAAALLGVVAARSSPNAERIPLVEGTERVER